MTGFAAIRRGACAVVLLAIAAVAGPADAACLVKPVFLSAKADGADTTVVTPSRWNDCRMFSGGTTGDLVVVDGADATYRSGLVASVATGRVLASGGAGVLPAWTTGPTLTTLFASGDAANSNLSLSADAGAGVTGNAPFLFTTLLNSTVPRWYTAFVKPSFGTLADNTIHWGGLMVKLGDTGSYIPAGKKGMPSSFETDIKTAQVAADMVAAESGHGYGATIDMTGGAPVHFMNATASINTTAVGTWSGIQLDIKSNVAGSTTRMINLISDGTQRATVGLYLSSNSPGFDFGIDLSDGLINTAAIAIPNAKPIQSKDSGGTKRNLLIHDGSNNLVVGGPLGGAGSVLALRPGLGEIVRVQDSGGAASFVDMYTATVSGAGTNPFLDVAGTWNTTGVVTGAIRANVTNTASGAGSRLLELQRGGTLQFGVTSGASGTGMQIRTAQFTAPTCTTNCGTGPSVTGTDTAIQATLGTGAPASPVTITVNGTWTGNPICMAANRTTAANYVTRVDSTTTTVVIYFAAGPSASDVLSVLCLGRA